MPPIRISSIPGESMAEARERLAAAQRFMNQTDSRKLSVPSINDPLIQHLVAANAESLLSDESDEEIYLPDVATGKDRVGIGAPGKLKKGNKPFSNSNVTINFDGVPGAYAPEGSGLIGYDNIENAIKEKTLRTTRELSSDVIVFKKIIVDGKLKNMPVITPEGYYISQTYYSRGNSEKQESYVNGDKVPFIALGGTRVGGAKPGDYIFIKNETNGKSSWGIYADKRDGDGAIEISPQMARNLGVEYTDQVRDNDWEIPKRSPMVKGKQTLTVTVYPKSRYGVFPGQ